LGGKIAVGLGADGNRVFATANSDLIGFPVF
jgi:hypothetical protein